ncbi:L-aspartate oxidase, partial [Cellulomonas triticagri]
GLAAASAALAAVRTDAHRTPDGAGGDAPVAAPQVAEWETTNVHQVATVLAATAATRRETRGGHLRSDHPERDDARWLLRVEARLAPDGTLVEDPTPLV